MLLVIRKGGDELSKAVCVLLSSGGGGVRMEIEDNNYCCQ